MRYFVDLSTFFTKIFKKSNHNYQVRQRPLLVPLRRGGMREPTGVFHRVPCSPWSIITPYRVRLLY